MSHTGYNSLLEPSKQYEFFRGHSRRRTVIIGLTAVFVITLFIQLFLRPTQPQRLQPVVPPDHDASK